MNYAPQIASFCEQHAIPYQRNAPLSELCTFRIGGPASIVIWPSEIGQIAKSVACFYEKKLPYIILGRGSNVLFHDEGYRGAVLLLGAGYSRISLADEGLLYCESGAGLSQLCRFALENSLSGLEFAYGIPGTVGGAVYMNAGAYGGEMKDVLTRTTHLNADGTKGKYQGEEMALSYRHSAYSDSDKIITGAYFRLRPGEKAEILGRMEEYMARRKEKQPLEYPSAGSTFKRPEGNYASALIDQCGLKGRQTGGAAVSEKHAGFVINKGGATGEDVRSLIALIQDEVRKKTGYELQCEIRLIENGR